MNETVTIPKVEYERLCAIEEDFADMVAARTVEAKIASGVEELVPAHVADRLIDRESPLRVWREYVTVSICLSACLWCQPSTDRRYRDGTQQRVCVHPSQAGRCP